MRFSVRRLDSETESDAPIESGPKLSYNGTSAFPYRLAARSMIRHSKSHHRASDLKKPPSSPHALIIKHGETVLTRNVHAPEGNRLQSVSGQSITGIEKPLNRATEVPAPGVDFAIRFPHEVVGKLLIRNFGTVTDTLRVFAGGLEALFEDFDGGLETVGILDRSLFQEGCECRTSQWTLTRRDFDFGEGDTYRHDMQLLTSDTRKLKNNELQFTIQRGEGYGRAYTSPQVSSCLVPLQFVWRSRCVLARCCQAA